MNQDQGERETMVIDLTGIDLHAMPALPATVLEISLRHILDERGGQPESYLGFMSAFSADN